MKLRDKSFIGVWNKIKENKSEIIKTVVSLGLTIGVIALANYSTINEITSYASNKQCEAIIMNFQDKRDLSAHPIYVDVQDYYKSDSFIRIISTDGKNYITSLENVLIIE